MQLCIVQLKVTKRICTYQTNTTHPDDDDLMRIDVILTWANPLTESAPLAFRKETLACYVRTVCVCNTDPMGTVHYGVFCCLCCTLIQSFWPSNHYVAPNKFLFSWKKHLRTPSDTVTFRLSEISDSFFTHHRETKHISLCPDCRRLLDLEQDVLCHTTRCRFRWRPSRRRFGRHRRHSWRPNFSRRSFPVFTYLPTITKT